MSETTDFWADGSLLQSLQPAAVVGYLRSKGWQKNADYGPNGALFRKTVGEREEEVLVPLERQARDFSSVMQLMISDLVKIEDRPSSAILSDLSIAGFDVIQVRSPEADSIGSIRLTAGVELHERARDMVLYAANVVASSSSRANWRGRRFEDVDKYISTLRLGQSQRGSFVISLLSRWEFVTTAEETQGLLGLTEDPFGRRATRTLGRALEATSKAIRQSATEELLAAFSPAVESGVSANFCQALADIAEQGDGADISIRWSYTRPESTIPTLKLQRDDVQLLREAAQQLASTEPLTDVSLEGLVTQLKEEPSTFDGMVTLEAPVEGALRRIRVEFDASNVGQRDILIDAFRLRKRVTVVGDLLKVGRGLRLNNPRLLSTPIATETDEQ